MYLEPVESQDKNNNWIAALERQAEEAILEMDGIEDVVDAIRKFLVSLISGANSEGVTISTADGQVL